ncbi:MAG: flagellin, partial [Lachnospiraceae bacterium]
ANENQTMEVRIPEVSTESLYIDDLNVMTINGADRAINQLDKALEIVSNTRSKIGAYQNRLDHAVASLDQENEDMTAALSRIEDADMAEEMTDYTRLNVLSQAATSVLAQANELPQQVLQLLQ